METVNLFFFILLAGIAVAALFAAERTARAERSRVPIPVRVDEPEAPRGDLY